MRIRIPIVAVALAAFALGCEDPETEGPRYKNCSADTDCNAGAEICHPVGKICVPTCESAADCPANQKNCGVVNVNGQPATTAKVCQCSTSEICEGQKQDEEATLVCSSVDNICEVKCTTDTDCADFSPARTCGTEGFCVLPAGACGGACTGDQVCDPVANTCVAKCTATSCTSASAAKCGDDGLCGKCTANADCANVAGGLNTCDTVNGTCVAGATCDPAAKEPNATTGGPDTCAYGQACTGSPAACVDVVAGTCAGAASVTWNKTAKSPVIVKLTAVTSATSNTTNECASGGPKIQAEIEFYAPNGLTWTSGADLLKRVVFVRSTGTLDEAAFVRGLPSSGAKFGTLTAGICFGTTPTLADRAVFLRDAAGNIGNPVCLQ